MIYRILLGIHSWNRWIVLILGVMLIVVAWQKWLGKASTTETTGKLSIFFIISVDIQLLLGIFLLFVSPAIATFMSDPGAGMSQSAIRFWPMEHGVMMLIATIVAHIGRVKLKKAADPIDGNRKAAIMFTIALVLMLLSIPWPFLSWGGRPLFFF